MFENIDFSTFNMPDSVITEIREGLISKESEFISLKATASANLTSSMLKAIKKTSRDIWIKNEVALLQHGTTKEEVWLFCKYLMVEIVKAAINGIADASEENIEDLQ